jgi:hypothetical protein
MPAQRNCSARGKQDLRHCEAPSRFSLLIARPTHENVKRLRELNVFRNSSSASEIGGRTFASLSNRRSSEAKPAGASLYQVTFPTLPKASLSAALAVLKAPLSVTPKAPIATSDSNQTSATIKAYSPRSCPESSFHRFNISASPFPICIHKPCIASTLKLSKPGMPPNRKKASPITGLAAQDVRDVVAATRRVTRRTRFPIPCFIALRLTVCSMLRSTSPLKKRPHGTAALSDGYGVAAPCETIRAEERRNQVGRRTRVRPRHHMGWVLRLSFIGGIEDAVDEVENLLLILAFCQSPT